MSSRSRYSTPYSRYRSRSRSHDRHYRERRNYRERRDIDDVKRRYHSRSRSPSYNRIDSRDKLANKRNYNRDVKRPHRNEKCSPHRRHFRSKPLDNEKCLQRSQHSKLKNIDDKPSTSTSSKPLNTKCSEQNKKKSETVKITPDCKEEQKPKLVVQSVFKNDGSFLDMFKQMQKQYTTNAADTQKDLPVPIGRRRRGVRALKTGRVEKAKVQEINEDKKSKEPWDIYISEVKKYRQKTCQEDAPSRSYVK
ncbi:uncharacterized protein DDB_G0283697-like [Ctenocephalides felis]|uniref:uncharacterized protein DDB_G0283697-like n=1 Tax=Ctenocephalides felis TaxID=7515 RepID=UPI000E6E485F|nr:uncharacterized protein DDB_G0283697-like [Ctenocephalides felis]